MDLIRSLLRMVAVAGLAASLIACGGDDGGDSPTTGGQSNNPQVPSDPPPTSENPPAANSRPTITGEPGTAVLVGQVYTFQPAASDPDNDTLTFTVSNLPDWAAFDERTGRISGTPDAEHVGSFSGITVTVSDGQASATLGPFEIVVTEVAGGSATLSWVPPTENLDGSPLTDLAGYEIRYGQDSSDLSETVLLDNPSLSLYVIENLTNGIWYFAVAAVNSQGVRSPLSDVASKTI